MADESQSVDTLATLCAVRDQNPREAGNDAQDRAPYAGRCSGGMHLSHLLKTRHSAFSCRHSPASVTCQHAIC